MYFLAKIRYLHKVSFQQREKLLMFYQFKEARVRFRESNTELVSLA